MMRVVLDTNVLLGALMSPDLPLTRRQHEMITTVVSATNRCRY